MIRIGGDKELPSKLETYPGYGYQTESGEWRINVFGIAYKRPPFTLRQKMILKMLGNAMHASESELDGSIFRDRVWPFFVDGDRGIKLHAKIGGDTFKLKKKTRKTGRFNNWLRIPNSLVKSHSRTDESGCQILDYEVVPRDGSLNPVSGSIRLLSRTGVSIVSDIDDTIKDSDVTNRRQLLKNSFLNEFKTIQGMSDVYQQWQDSGAAFHYVSSSPWQLYNPLSQLISDGDFPNGNMHLRNFRLRDELLKPVMILRRKGKAIVIKKLMKHLPDRKFILIGDSGEKDPEIYSKLRRKFPNQVVGLFIRELSDRPMHAERMSKLGKGKKRWRKQPICQVFKDADNLDQLTQSVFEKLQHNQKQLVLK